MLLLVLAAVVVGVLLGLRIFDFVFGVVSGWNAICGCTGADGGGRGPIGADEDEAEDIIGERCTVRDLGDWGPLLTDSISLMRRRSMRISFSISRSRGVRGLLLEAFEREGVRAEDGDVGMVLPSALPFSDRLLFDLLASVITESCSLGGIFLTRLTLRFRGSLSFSFSFSFSFFSFTISLSLSLSFSFSFSISFSFSFSFFFCLSFFLFFFFLFFFSSTTTAADDDDDVVVVVIATVPCVSCCCCCNSTANLGSSVGNNCGSCGPDSSCVDTNVDGSTSWAVCCCCLLLFVFFGRSGEVAVVIVIVAAAAAAAAVVVVLVVDVVMGNSSFIGGEGCAGVSSEGSVNQGKRRSSSAVGRFWGSFWKQALRTLRSFREHVSGMGTENCTILNIAVMGFRSKYGGNPVSSSMIVHPTLQMSDENVCPLSEITSGATTHLKK